MEVTAASPSAADAPRKHTPASQSASDHGRIVKPAHTRDAEGIARKWTCVRQRRRNNGLLRQGSNNAICWHRESKQKRPLWSRPPLPHTHAHARTCQITLMSYFSLLLHFHARCSCLVPEKRREKRLFCPPQLLACYTSRVFNKQQVSHP